MAIIPRVLGSIDPIGAPLETDITCYREMKKETRLDWYAPAEPSRAEARRGEQRQRERKKMGGEKRGESTGKRERTTKIPTAVARLSPCLRMPPISVHSFPFPCNLSSRGIFDVIGTTIPHAPLQPVFPRSRGMARELEGEGRAPF